MGLPSVASSDDWRRREIVSAVVTHFVEKIGEKTSLTLDGLRADPISALERNTDIAVVVTRRRLDSCSVFGHYNPHPPTITLSETHSARDAFTVLHEYCHHLQMQDAPWQDVLWQIDSRLRLWIEEDVCDAFASAVLIPTELVASTVSAAGLRGLHAQTSASRQATVVRAVRAADSRDAAFAAVCELDGTVMFGISSAPDVLAPPPRQLIQPDFADLIRQTSTHEPILKAPAKHGIVYSSGTTRHDVILEVAIDISGNYAFIVGTKDRYSDAAWDVHEVVCSSEACNEVFQPNGDLPRCSRCRAWRCPACGSCECESAVRICTKCSLALSAADRAAGRTCHDECW
jgi:hypothetical protein